MAGLSRSKNLSENNLNLKTAIQKLYRSGIENDIELFSLSSKITSTVIAGKEILNIGDPLSQIYSVESQKIKVNTNSGFQTLNRTKFNTRYFTFTNNNQVYFTKFNIAVGAGTVSRPIFSQNGSVSKVKVIYGGEGYYFENENGSVYTTVSQEISVSNVRFIGKESGSDTLTGTVIFEKETLAANDQIELFTPSSTDRYRIKSVSINGRGSRYLIPENLDVVEDEVYFLLGTSIRVRLKKQRGSLFPSKNPIIRTELYTYRVVDADASGFFLYDDLRNQYVFINNNVNNLSIDSVELKRDDSIKIENLLQFKFAGSNIYLDEYEDPYSIGESISIELSNLGANVQNLITSVRTAIQNTKLPTLATADDNVLGFQYNEFVGRDVVIWQRVVIRDQDFLLDPGLPGSRTGLTGELLRTNVNNFTLDLNGTDIKIPGLFIKVGNEYFRAFSTTDKPFFNLIGTTVVNPNLSTNRSKTDIGALSAEGLYINEWYAYNTQIAQLAQRIHPNGKDGAFYFHRSSAPTIKTISVKKGGVNSNIYAVPLFTITN